MEWGEAPGTRPEVVMYLRDEVRPLIAKMVAKRAASYSDLLTAQDREDLVGVVLTKYHNKWGRDERPDRLGAWLKPVVEASIVDELRRQGARPRIANLPNDDEGVRFDELLVALRTPSSVAHTSKLLGDALAEVAKKYPTDVELIRLRYLNDLDLTEIAIRLGVGEETAKKRLQRATTRLRNAVVGLAGSNGL